MTAARGYRGGHRVLFRQANQQVMKARQSAYAHRRKRRSAFRSVWITRIQSIVRYGSPGVSFGSYGSFMSTLSKKSIRVNRKSLAQLAHTEQQVYHDIFARLF